MNQERKDNSKSNNKYLTALQNRCFFPLTKLPSHICPQLTTDTCHLWCESYGVRKNSHNYIIWNKQGPMNCHMDTSKPFTKIIWSSFSILQFFKMNNTKFHTTVTQHSPLVPLTHIPINKYIPISLCCCTHIYLMYVCSVV